MGRRAGEIWVLFCCKHFLWPGPGRPEFLLASTFPRKLYEKNRWGTQVNGKMFSIFWVWLAGFLSFLFLSVQFNSVRCWSWSEFKYYRKETSSHQRKTSHIHLSPSSSHLCCDLTYDRPRLTRSGSNSGQNCLHTLLLIEKHNWLIFPVVYSRLSRQFRMKNE